MSVVPPSLTSPLITSNRSCETSGTATGPSGPPITTPPNTEIVRLGVLRAASSGINPPVLKGMTVNKQPRPKKLKALRQRYSGVTYTASIHRQDEEGNWIVEKISCLCSERAEQDVKHLLSEIDRLEELIAHLLKHHVPCEECVEYLTPIK